MINIEYLYAAIGWLVVYLGGIYLLYGILPSISQSFYELPKCWRWLFTVFLFGFSMLIIQACPKPVMFAGALCIMGVGMVPYFSKPNPITDKNQRWQHYILAAVGMGLCVLSTGIELKLPYVMSIGFIGGVFIASDKELKNRMLWLELFIIADVIVGILIKHYSL
jgi:hypothetical protein